MKSKPKLFDYGNNLGESLSLMFKNPKIFIPILIYVFVSSIFNFLFIPSLNSLIEGELNFSFLWFTPLIFVIGIIILSWLSIIIKNILNKKKINLYKDFKTSLNHFLNLLLLYLGIYLIIAGALVLIILLSIILLTSASNILVLSVFLIILLAIISVMLLVAFISGSIYAPVIYFTENKDVMSTLKLTYNTFIKNKTHAIVMLILSFVILIIVNLVASTFLQIFIPPTDMIYYILEHTGYYTLLSIPGTFLSITASIWIYTFYFKSYQFLR